MFFKLVFLVVSIFGDVSVPWSPAHSACALFSGSDYLPALEAPKYCRSEGSEWCCTWMYVVDRFCCPGDSYNKECWDDCTPEEREEDRENALWASEEYCINLVSPCDWTYNAGGFSQPDLPSEESGCGEESWDDEKEWLAACMDGGENKISECRDILRRLKGE